MKRREFGGRLRYVVAGWAVLETMLFGGLVNGWAALVFVLKEDRLYSHLCDAVTSTAAVASSLVDGVNGGNGSSAFSGTTAGSYVLSPEEPLGCTAQDGKLNLWFTIAAALRNIFGIVIGLHIFKFGTRSARLTGWVLFGIGALMMAFADESNPWLVLPSLMALSYGGVTLLLTNVQVSCLFPRVAGVIVTLVSGGFDFSAATQLAVKILHESGMVSRLYSFVGLAVLHAFMVLFSTLCFMPKDMLVHEAAEGDVVSQAPPHSPRLRQRRDSLYDWSEIKFHASHNGLRCGSCEESSNDGEQREQVASDHEPTVGSPVQNGIHTYMNVTQCACQWTIKAANMLQNDIPKDDMYKTREEQITSPNTHVIDYPDVPIEINGKFIKETDFSSARKHVVKNSTQLDHPSSKLHVGSPNTKPCFQNQDGIPENNTKVNTPIITVSEMMEKSENDRNRKMNSSPRKFISIIDVPSQSKTTIRKSNGPCPEVDGKTDTVHSPHHQSAVNGSSNGQVNGHRRHHHKVTLQPDDERSEKGNCEEEEGERKKAEEKKKELYPTLKSCLQSAVFWLHVLWHSFNVLRLVAVFGLINTKLTAMFDGDKDKVSFFTNVQAYFMLAILGVCWISELFMTGRPRFSKVSERYFGILNGILSIIAGTFCFLQYAILSGMTPHAEGPFQADVFMLLMVMLGLVHPLHIVIKSMV